MKIDTPRTFDPAFGVHLGIIPFDRSYWVVPGRLLAGLYPSSDDQGEASDKLQRLLGVGVRHVINLTEPVEKNWKGVPLSDYEPELKAIANQQKLQITCRRHKIRDLDVPTIDMMKLILNDIDEAILASRTVYVHCWGGRGRTGVVVGCFLARHGMATGDTALNMIRYLRRTDAKADTEAPETAAQKEFVRSWLVGQ
jgi:protein-tyrosine phosphatase